ncbi:MAG: DUF4845 domain-containing protein [Proteobacteria bacterium]|nr:DUF4845 domain-containing protein [Pseudomonadota bacterium]HQR04744.1 DUF4845 domain-containing protein [Rhodocyclaceae bacterium]
MEFESGVSRQHGVSLIGLLFVGAVIAAVAMVGMKVFPAVSEYTAIVRAIKATAADPALKDGSVEDIRRAYNKRAEVDYIESVKGDDLDITKDNGHIVISASYSRKIPLFANVSLVLDFDSSSAGATGE